jgi:hypothetical protein
MDLGTRLLELVFFLSAWPSVLRREALQSISIRLCVNNAVAKTNDGLLSPVSLTNYLRLGAHCNSEAGPWGTVQTRQAVLKLQSNFEKCTSGYPAECPRFEQGQKTVPRQKKHAKNNRSAHALTLHCPV